MKVYAVEATTGFNNDHPNTWIMEDTITISIERAAKLAKERETECVKTRVIIKEDTDD